MKRFLKNQELIVVVIGLLFLAVAVLVSGLYEDEDGPEPAPVYYVSDSQLEVLKNEGAVSESNRLNINTATKQELMELEGIGEATALNIIEARERSGGFENPEELLEVEGIGNERYETIKHYIYCGKRD